MDIIFLLIPIAIVLAGLATWAFFWSVNNGQYDDLGEVFFHTEASDMSET